MMLAANRMRGKRNRAIGQQSEALALRAVTTAGVRLAEQVHTPWRIQRGPKGNIIGASPVAKVSGDIRGLLAGGRSVLVEVKAREGRLVYSDLEAHQVLALTEHARHGGLSLLCWVRLTPFPVCCLMHWDALTAIGFAPRSSLTIEQAEGLTIPPGSL